MRLELSSKLPQRPESRAGEVYVLNDGGEVDLDLGNYERYLDVTLSKDNNITTGKIYKQVIEREVSLFGRYRRVECSWCFIAQRRISWENCSGACIYCCIANDLILFSVDCTSFV